jgi:hypothetical protein
MNQSERMTLRWKLNREAMLALGRRGIQSQQKQKLATADFRLWKRIDRKTVNECWPIIGAKIHKGCYYPTICYKGLQQPFHKAIWKSFYGQIKPGARICHKCDNVLCGNPHHLYEGTQKMNMHDAIRRGRFKFLTVRRGEESPRSKLTEKDVAAIRDRYDKIPYKEKSSFAAKFGICRAAARRIANGIGWNHVHP